MVTTMNGPIATTVIGSYPQPPWLVDTDQLIGAGVPRVRADGIWLIEAEHRAEAIEAATLVAIADQEQAGIDIVTDGEIGRESYFNHFANSLGGVDQNEIGHGTNRLGGRSDVPLVNGPIRRSAPIEADAARFLRDNTDRRTKITVPGPFTLSQLADNRHYPDQGQLAMAYAAAINEELRELESIGIDVLQLDEPYLQANAEAAADFAVDAIAAAMDGIEAETVVHTCYGYAVYVKDKQGGYPYLQPLATTGADCLAIEAAQPELDVSVLAELGPCSIILGVIDLSTKDVESPDVVASRIRAALDHLPAERLIAAPDCGMKFLPRQVAKAKLSSLAQGAALVNAELASK